VAKLRLFSFKKQAGEQQLFCCQMVEIAFRIEFIDGETMHSKIKHPA